MIIWMLWSVMFAMVIGIAAFAAERVTASLGVARRHVWMVALVAAAVVPPILAFERPNDRPVAPSESAAAVPARQPDVPSGRSAAAAVRPLFPPPRVRTVPPPALESATADRWALALWAFASLSLGLVFARAMFALGRRRTEWHEREVGSYRVLLAPNAGPAVVGFARPRIVIPQWALALDETARDLMLRHETEHIRAGDPRTLFAAGALLVAFPWNLALWMIVRQLRRAMELDCDARVIRAVGGPADYGMVLLTVGERYTTSLPLAASLAAPRPLLEQRIDAMTTPRPRRPFVAALPFAAIVLLATVAAARAPRPAPVGPIALIPRHAAHAHASPPAVAAPAPAAIAAAPIRPAGATAPTVAPPLVTQTLAARPGQVDRALARALIAANYPKLVSGETKADYVVMVFDASNNFTWSTAGIGTALISVGGDTLTNVQRLQLQARERNVPDYTSSVGGRGALPVRRPYNVVSMPVLAVKPDLSDTSALRALSRLEHDSRNTAAGLVIPALNTDESGIEGVPASQVMYVDSWLFPTGDLAPSVLQVLVVHLTPAASNVPAAAIAPNTTVRKADTTGADSGSVHHAKVLGLVILPLPIPSGVKPYYMQACFDVESDGHAKLLQWTPSADTAYNRKIFDALRGYQFAPAQRFDGTPVRDTVRDTVCVRAKAG